MLSSSKSRGAWRERVFDLSVRPHFNLDRFAGRLNGGPRALDRDSHSARQANVVVFDQNRVVETHSMIDHAACGRSHLFENAKAGSGLARIQDADPGPIDGGDELRC